MLTDGSIIRTHDFYQELKARQKKHLYQYKKVLLGATEIYKASTLNPPIILIC